jgi:DNA-binding transcriptional LysR family regulator
LKNVSVKDLTAHKRINIRASALQGFGLAYMPEDQALPYIKDRRLLRALEDWCPPFSGYHLYYLSRRYSSAAFAPLVDVLRVSN